MSFQDLERGLTERAPLARDIGISPESDLKFKALARSVSLQIHKINANVSAITKLVELLGTAKDTEVLRKKLHNLTDVTRDVLKSSTTDVKNFANWELLPDDRQHKQEQQKVSIDFQKALNSFQAASKRSAERQKTFVEKAKAKIDIEASGLTTSASIGDGEEGSQLMELGLQRQSTVDAIPDSEVEFQEQLIQEREGEIEQIEQGITELNQIFRDLGEIVVGQQSMIDNIETNVYSVAQDTRGASEQLVQAHTYQRKAGRRMLCLLSIFLVVLSIVLLAILS